MNHAFVVHIEWEGPIPFEEIGGYTTEKDYGIYQIYGWHPLYGADVLLYIGKADRQHFGVRIPQESWWHAIPSGKKVSVHLGRLAGIGVPDDSTWGAMIAQAERLLIFAHTPAHNAQKSIHQLDQALHDIHVLNWGSYRDLYPELTGSRWSSKLGDMPGYQVYDAEAPRSTQSIQFGASTSPTDHGTLVAKAADE